ncbi:unnamed protein product, partial [Laminaria digitata]
GPRKRGEEEIPHTFASYTGWVFKELDQEKKAGFSLQFAKDFLPTVDGLQDGEQADAAEVMMAIFQALSEVSGTHERYHFSLSRCKALRIRTPNLNPADASAAPSAA